MRAAPRHELSADYTFVKSTRRRSVAVLRPDTAPGRSSTQNSSTRRNQLSTTEFDLGAARMVPQTYGRAPSHAVCSSEKYASRLFGGQRKLRASPPVACTRRSRQDNQTDDSASIRRAGLPFSYPQSRVFLQVNEIAVSPNTFSLHGSSRSHSWLHFFASPVDCQAACKPYASFGLAPGKRLRFSH